MPESSASPRLRVLVADDNKDAADTLGQLVTAWGHEVQVAYDGLVALQAAQKVPPDVALVDLGLPSLDGYQVALRLREQAGTRRLLLIAITGFDWKGAQRRSEEYGFDYHLVKPIEPEELRRLLETLKTGGSTNGNPMPPAS
jgi:CheY-like chemotaxis protein